MSKTNYTNILIVTFALLLLAFPSGASAVTLKDYEDQVAKYTDELNNKKNQIAKNDQEVAEIKAKIADIKEKIQVAYDETVALQNEIDQSNIDIDNKNEEIKNIVKYYQLSSSGNAYLEYILGADSITDMIYRLSVSEQLTKYNDRVIKELNQLIEDNKKKQTELDDKQKELTKLNSDLYNEQSKIEAETEKIEGTIPDVQGEIANAKKMVSYYKAKGCSSNDIIGVTCDVPVKVNTNPGSSSSIGSGALIGSNGFRFPVNGGYITQSYGNAGHKGVDIGKGCGTPIYAVASGRVYYVGSDLDLYGAMMVGIVHNVNGKLVFSMYAHLQGYNVSVGQDVTYDTIIGYMGNTGYSFGCHLHLEMSENAGWGYNAVYTTYTRNIINPFTYVPL